MIPFSNPLRVYMVSTSEQSQPARLTSESPNLPVLLLRCISWQRRSESPRASACPSRFTSVVENPFPWHHTQCYAKLTHCKPPPCKLCGEEEAELLSQTRSWCPRHPRGADVVVHKLSSLPRWLSLRHAHPSLTQTVARARGTASSSGLRSTSVTAQYMNKYNRKPRSD